MLAGDTTPVCPSLAASECRPMTTLIETITQHPLSAAFPLMGESELTSLAADIKANGLLEPAISFEGMVLDGWHRYLACKQAKVKFVSQPFEGADPVAFVIARNLHRRHLTGSQRAAAVVAASEWRPAGRIGKGEVASPLSTNAEMARVAEVTPRTIKHAKEAQRAGRGEDVRDGKISAYAAAQADKPKPSDKKPPDYKALYEAAASDLDDARETIRELDARVRALEITEPTDQQKEIVRLQREAEALKQSRNEFQTKCNELIRQVRSLQRRAK